MFTFLMDLNSEYENLVSQLIHREKLTNLDEAIGEIVKAESRKGVSVESSHGGVSSSSATFISKTPAPSINSNSTPRIQHQEPSMKNSTPADSYSQDKETLVSYYCKKKGHTKDKCHKLAYKLLQQMQTQHPKKAFVAQDMGESVSNPLPETMNEKLKIDREERPKTNISSTSMARSGIISTATNVVSSSSSYSMLWVLDTSATNHMTPNKVWLISYDSVTNPHRVLIVGGEVLDVEGSGVIQLSKCTLKNVLHVPSLKMNLISLQKFVKDTGDNMLIRHDKI